MSRSRGLLAVILCVSITVSLKVMSSSVPKECIQIFYDQSKDRNYWMGRTYSTFLQNLLAHWPQYQQIVGPIEEYRKGDLDRCKASFYIGSYFENSIPPEFFEDYATTSKAVMWMGYSIWRPGVDYFEKIFGYQFSGLTKLNTEILDQKKRPTFFKFATYKGEQFLKYGDFSRTDPTQFLAPFENVVIKPTANAKNSEVLSELIHNGTKERIPYIIRNQNKFYVADVPFSFMHEADRFLIVADVLFDVLGEKPMHGNEKIAFLRMEDVFPMISLPFTFDMLKVLKEMNIRSNISLVPIYSDPLQLLDADIHFLAMDDSPAFLNLLGHMKKDGHDFIWHGVTHQYEDMRNPWDGVSTDDFEFWDAPANRPVAKDSVDWVLSRLDDGMYSLGRGKIAPIAWLTPHYQASALDYLMFARVFEWNVGRVIYHDFQAENVPKDSATLRYDSPSGRADERQKAFQDMKVKTQGPWSGQLFPFLIYGDVYGQRLVPENLGNSQPYLSNHVVIPRSVGEMVEDARRNRVLRDAWASFFYHPALLDTVANGGRGQFPGDASDLRYLITEIQNLGYRFVTMSEVKQRWTLPKRPPTLSLKETR